MPRRHFTLEEADALIATVAPRMDRALQLHLHIRQEVGELRRRGMHVTPLALTNELDQDAADPNDGALELARGMYSALRDEIAAIEELGAEVKGVAHGLVDFWSWLDGEREVLLCWKIGEPRMAFYHLPDAGFAGRAPVAGHRFTRTRGLGTTETGKA